MNIGTILYVEDDENDALFLRHAWKKAGLGNPLQIVENGEQALHYLGGEGEFADRARFPMPILILLDLKLPKVSGFEVLKWIRKQPPVQTLPVIIFTSSNQLSDVHWAYKLGANAYVIKPASSDGLVAVTTSLKEFWITRAEIPPESSKFEAQTAGV